MGIDPRDVEDIYPLSPAQRGILFHALFDAGAAVYVNQVAVTVPGPLDRPAFEQAWQALAARHGALRTSFHWEDLRQPLQVVQRRGEIPVAWTDVQGLSAAERQDREDALLAEDRARGFALDRAPLLRVHVLAGAGRCRLIISYHHILLDAWSVAVLLRELLALAEKPGARLEEPPRYGRYVSWLAGRSPAEDEAFWRAELAGVTAPTPLPGERARPGAAAAAGSGERRLLLSAESTEAIRAMARQRRLTVSSLFHAGWAVVLSRYAAEPEVVFGSVVSGRSAPVAGIDAMVGLFINTLPLRVPVAGAPSFAALAEAVQRRQGELIVRAHCALTDIQGQCAVPRGLPLFESILVFENVRFDPALTARAGAAESRQFRQVEQSSYPLTLVVHDEAQLELLVAYDPARLDGPFAEALLGHLATVVEAGARAPEEAPRRLPMLAAQERKRILEDWNRAAAPVPESGACVHQLVEAQARRTPDAAAVSCGSAALTYRELNARANRLAHRLRREGVGPEARVGVLLQPSVETVVALLGVLKAGGAYVPLDPDAPRERLAHCLRDAGARLVLTQRALLKAVPDGLAPLPVDDPSAFAAEPGEDPPCAAAPANLAYVIYTSGSTGLPKGVLVSHRSVVNHNQSVARAFELSAADRLLHFTPLPFDAAVEEIFPPLIAGATVVVQGELVPAAEFNALVERERLTVLSLPPAFAHEWVCELQRLGRRLPGTLRLVLLGGEKILPETFALWRALGGADVPWINVYGPSEATVTSALCHIGGRAQGVDQPVLPIGHPIPNARIHVLGPAGELLPAGIAGELHIGGAGLARGYLNQPDLTAEKFVPDPFSQEPGARLYRTGDLGRYLPDGRLEFVGRVDTQVKIRGNRVEPGEVEAALRKLPGVKDAAVVAREGQGGRQLVAYVVPEAPGAVAVGALRRGAAERLPDYMVPQAFVLLDALPLTPNGKVDRRALPAPDAAALDRAEYVAPRTPLEEAVARSFAEVLKVERVGARDDFFGLGGHSLVALQAVSRLQSALGRPVALRTLFEAPVVAQLAERLQAEAAAPAEQAPAAVEGPAPLSFAQERLWFIHQLEPESSAYNIPLQITLRGPLDHRALEATLTALVERHQVLRTSFARQDGQPVQVVQPAAPWRVEVVDLSGLAPGPRGEEARRQAEAAMRAPFDLSRGPMLRTTLLRLGPEEHQLLLTAHHIAVDGWSLGVMGREFVSSYAALRSGRPSPLPPPRSQYADFARRQRAEMVPERVAAHLDYWREKLAGAAPLQLPADRPPPRTPTYRRGMKVFELPAPLADRARALAREEGASLFMLLLAAYQAVLCRYTGQDDVLVGTDVAGRTPETEDLVGYFVNQLPLRVSLKGDPPFRELLRRVRATALEAYAHQALPFEELVKVWNPERSAYHHGPLQVKLTFQSFAAPSQQELRAMGVEIDEIHSETTQFNFAVVVDEIDGALRVTVNFHRDLFDPESAERFAGHFLSALESATERPDTPVSALRLLTGAERQALGAWNQTSAPLPAAAGIHQLVEEQADRTPDALAVAYRERSLTYRQLDERANQLAHHLRGLGAGPDQRVGVLLEPSADTLVALLGILKAGAAYVPMAPDAPEERLAFMVRDARVAAVVTTGALAGRLPGEGVAKVALDGDAGRIADCPATRPSVGLQPDHLAYVVYTSGSTGEPKGVLVQHRNAVNHTCAVRARFGLGPADRLLQFTPIQYDAAVEEIFPPLSTGAAVVVRGELVPSAELEALIDAHRVTVLSLPPAYVHEWVQDLSRRGQGVPRSVRLVILGGEKINPETMALWRKLPGGAGAPWINVYGPTEATVTAAMCDLSRTSLDAPLLPIGGPVANVQLHVLDARMQQVPLNVPGELYIGGAGVARGYLGRPELTAEKFVPDPYSARPGARLYRTGDVARINGRGQAEFLGRVDTQVKLRGHRIELGEVEAALRAFPDVAEAVAVVREDRPGDPRLVGYVVPQPGAVLAAAQLRAHLRRTLPEPMVPSAFVELDALPLTPNGKVDRRALPAPSPAAAETTRRIWPRTAAEAQIAALWEEILQCGPVGVTEDFFSLGGHSLMAVRMIDRIAEVTGGRVELTDLFEQPTIEHLAGVLERSAGAGAGAGGAAAPASRVVGLQPHGDRRPLFLVPAAGGTALSYLGLSRLLGTDQPVWAFQAPGLEDGEPPLDSVEALAERFLEALRARSPRGPYRLGGYSSGGTVAYEMAQRLAGAGEKVELLALLDTYSAALEQRLDQGRPTLTGGTLDDALLLIARQRGLPAEALAAAAPEERWDRVLQALVASGAAPPGFGKEALQRLVRVYLASVQAQSSYRPRPYGGTVTLVRADASAQHGDPSLGWAELAPGRVEILPVPGTHQDILEDQLEAVAQALRAALDRPVN